MKQERKVLCIIGVGIIGVLLTATTVYACCGMYPEITDDPVEAGCCGEEVTISGIVTLTKGDLFYMPTPPDMTIDVQPPTGGPVQLTVTVDNLQEYGDIGPPDTRYATYDFEATYTPTEVGTYTYTKTAVDVYDQTTRTDTKSGTFEVEPCPVEVEIDIKPGSCPNPFNAKSKGLVPVAIVGTAGLDLGTIDPETICLTTPSGNVVCAVKSEILDSTQPGDPDPYDPEDCYDCFDADDPANFNCDLWNAAEGLPVPPAAPDSIMDAYCGDEIPDLVVYFDTGDLAAAIGEADRDDCVVLTLTGDTDDPCFPIVGSDSVVIKTKIKPPKP
jgi:hypothetical protein